MAEPVTDEEARWLAAWLGPWLDHTAGTGTPYRASDIIRRLLDERDAEKAGSATEEQA